jgi:hypothetical protein
MPEAFIRNTINFLNFKELISFGKSRGFILSEGLLCTASSRAWTLAPTRRSWFPSHRSWCVNWFSKQSAIALAFSDGWNSRSEEPWMAVGELGPFLFGRDFAVGQLAWGVTSVLLIFVFHRSSALLRVIRWTNFVTQWTAALHAGSLVSCHNFLNFGLLQNQNYSRYIAFALVTQKT